MPVGKKLNERLLQSTRNGCLLAPSQRKDSEVIYDYKVSNVNTKTIISVFLLSVFLLHLFVKHC